MRKTLLTALVVGLLTIVMAVPALANNGKSGDPHGRPDFDLTIVVTGGTEATDDDVTYSSIPLGELPMNGRFQLLEPNTTGSDAPLMTEFGPGDHGYVGGRWWVDVNGNGEMDSEDAFFLCPLLGPGH
ncbi:MAG: hypothetical protein U9R51_07105 [Actinomycetota bacterium]|nr:hypothetical protein [Actinomycetota bacterium]